MGEIFQFAVERMKREDHLEGEAFCVACGQVWIALAPLGTYELECPRCGSLKGLFRNGCFPNSYWTCACGCHAFTIDDLGRIICYNCGMYQEISGGMF